MYFDHAGCSTCGARFQPESVGAGGTCPSCGSTLRMKDLFGVADHLVEEAPERVTFNDLAGAARPGEAPTRKIRRPALDERAEKGVDDVLAALAAVRRDRR